MCYFYVILFVMYNYLLGKGGYVFGSVGLSVCLWTTLLKKSDERIGMKFYGGVLGSPMKN